MAVFLVIILLIDGILLVAAHSQSQPWASSLCRAVAVCSHTTWLLTFGIVLGCILLVMRSAR
jgi:hypothetical protein